MPELHKLKRDYPAVAGPHKLGGVSRPDYSGTPSGKFLEARDAGLLPDNAILVGTDVGQEPLYAEITDEQMRDLEKEFRKESKDAPKYYANLLYRVGLKPASNTDVKAQARQWDSMSVDDKERVLSIWHYQATEEEGRVTTVSPWEFGLMVVGETGQAIKRRVEPAASSLAPGVRETAIAAASIATTLGEMVVALPLTVGLVLEDPRKIKDVALGMKDFTVEAAKRAYGQDPWAIGQMTVIVGTAYLGGKPLVRSVRNVTPKVANRLSSALGRLDSALKSNSTRRIQSAGENLQKVADEAAAEGVDVATVDTIRTLGSRTVQQAENLSTVSVEAIQGIKLQLENAGAETVSVGRGRYTVKPKVETPTKEVTAKDVGMSDVQFDRYVRYRASEWVAGREPVSPEIFKLKENADFNRLLEDVTRESSRQGGPTLTPGRRIPVPERQQFIRPTEGARFTFDRQLESARSRIRQTEKHIADLKAQPKTESLVRAAEDALAKERARLAEIEAASRRTDAAEIVRQARENETVVNQMAGRAMAEIEAMSVNRAATELVNAPKTEATAMTATQTETLVRTLSKLDRADRGRVVSQMNLNQTVAAALIMAANNPTTENIAAARTIAENQLEEELIDQAITDTVKETAVRPATTPATTPAPAEETVTTIVPEEVPKEEVAPREETAVDIITSPAPIAPPAPTTRPTPRRPEERITERERTRRARPRLWPRREDAAPREEEAALPAGTIVWKQGLFWRAVAPPYKAERPMVLERPPLGARNTDDSGPGSARRTLQVLGGLPPRNVDVDLGWVDIHIRGAEDQIWMDFSSGGERTNVGIRSPSTTAGMTVRGAPEGRPGPGSLTEQINKAPSRTSTPNLKPLRGLPYVRREPQEAQYYRRAIRLAQSGRLLDAYDMVRRI